jgi:hypothetical protein
MSSIDAPIPVVTTTASVRTWARAIALTTVLVGLSDFIQSYLLFSLARHGPAIGVLQGPATGLLGRAAMMGGARTALLGTVLHFLIAFAWTLAFALLYRNLPALRERTRTVVGLLVCAVAVGVVVWLTMNSFVLRFSKAHHYALSEPYFWWLLAGHIPFVGFPIVWGISRLSPHSSPAT